MACNLMSRHQTSAVDLKFLQIVCTHVKELQIQNRTRSHRVASVPWIPKFAHECAAKECELRNRDTSIGRPDLRPRVESAARPSAGLPVVTLIASNKPFLPIRHVLFAQHPSRIERQDQRFARLLVAWGSPST